MLLVNILTPISHEPVTKYRHAHLPKLSWMAHTVEELSTSVTKYRHALLPKLSWMAHTVEELSTSVTPAHIDCPTYILGTGWTGNLLGTP